jgi:DUF4097 and DUF4098 domain-containing protein YvlB
MRHGVTAFAVAALLAAPPASAETVRQQSRRAVDIGDASTVSVQNSRGQIEVRPSPDRQVHVTALKVIRAASSRLTDKLAAETQVELLRDGPRYRIRVDYPKGMSVRVNLWEGINEFSVPRVEMRLIVLVPAGVAIELEGASVDLSTEGLAGRQRLETASGDIAVESATGPVTVTTASGDVTVTEARALEISSVSGDVKIEQTRGPVSIGTSSGDVSVGGLTDSVEVRTVSGDVSVERAPAGARIRTSSGEIQLQQVSGRLYASTVSAEIHATLMGPVREARLESSSGDVTLALASSASCALEMSTSSGDIDVQVPSQTRTVSRRLVTAVVRQGTAPVRVQTVSGNITVTRGEP